MKQAQMPVMIHLLAIARYDQMPEYPIQFMTRGVLTVQTHDTWTLTYQEVLPEEGEGEGLSAEVTLTVTPRHVTMNRSGEVNNTMVFAKGKRFEGFYTTPYGAMDMAVNAREVTSRREDGRGSVHLKYDLEFQGNYASSNELHLEFFEGQTTTTEDEKNETAAE